MNNRNDSQVIIETWTAADFPLLQLINAPEMMEHLGGSETEELLANRHERYLAIADKGTGRMFTITLLPEGQKVGSVGYWDSARNGESIYEIGWSVLPNFQGKGIATAAVREAIASAEREGKHRYVHAFPSIGNPASNAVCRKLNFQPMGECEFEYPPGNLMQCNDWRFEIERKSCDS
ncbi:GNAT family N-acetyltransferase [Cohnella soli]|uniref:GNAT family N-acetyltransferase n=1 Tax=Cohnella soli TaxID=425005 RepID=A0ABW0I0E5_9BACL